MEKDWKNWIPEAPLRLPVRRGGTPKKESRQNRKMRRSMRYLVKNPVGIKAWWIQTADGRTMMTAWASKEKKRRRSLRKVQHESRRRNR
jgi:hypothetical protein